MKLFPGWWQVAAAMLLQAASSASVFTAYSVVAVPLQETFEPSRAMLMMGITLAAAAAGLLGPPLGAAIDRLSVRLLMLAGTFLLGGGFVLLSFAQDIHQALLVYMLPLALGCVATGPLAGSALLARWFSRRRGLAMSLAASGAGIGGLVIPPLMQWMIDTLEWRQALQVFGIGLTLVTAPIVALLVVNTPADRGVHPDGDSSPPATGGPGTGSSSMLVFLRDRNFWLVAVCVGAVLAGPMGLVSNLVPLAMDRQVSAAVGALLLSVYSGANLGGKLLAGVLTDRHDSRVLLGVNATFVALAFVGFWHATGHAMLVACCLLLGTFQGGTVPLWSVMLARLYGPQNMGRSMGLMGLVLMPMTLVAAPLFGWVYDLSGSYNIALVGYAGLTMCTLVLIPLLSPMRGEAAAR